MQLTDLQVEDVIRTLDILPTADRQSFYSMSLEAIQTVRAEGAGQKEDANQTRILDGRADLREAYNSKDGHTGEVCLTIRFKLPPELSPQRVWWQRMHEREAEERRQESLAAVGEWRKNY